MKKLPGILLIAFLFCFAGTVHAYEIILKSNYRSGMAYLTYYMGRNHYLEDSAMVDKNGLAVFRNDKQLPGGIYSIVFPGMRLYADFLVDKSQKFTITADTTRLLEMQVSNSPENDLFRNYQSATMQYGKKINDEKEAYAKARSRSDSAAIEARLKKLTDELNTYRNGIISSKQNSMLAVLLQAMKDPALPTKVPKTRADTLENYYFYRNHYWDGIDFMDERLVRTPFFQPKVERYYREVMMNLPVDTIIKDIDTKLLYARNAPELNKFLLNWLTDEYINPKIMGQDAIFVHLYNKYHSKGLTPWLSDKQHEAITKRAFMVMGNLVGEPAANLEMYNINDKLTYLYDLKSEYTVLAFWDPNCGHCKTEIPRLDSMYNASWKGKGVQMVGVTTENDLKAWKAFISEHHMEPWTHLYQPDNLKELARTAGRADYKQLYDIMTTPTFYLLDKDKKILAKKLSIDQINDFLQYKWSQAKK